jgi:hypothetical protein
MPVQIQIRNGTAAQWTSANPVLAAGEVGIETDTRKQKFGDGTTAWNSLAYAGGTGTVTGVTGTSPVVSSGGAAPAISLASEYGDTLNPYASKTANQVLAAPNGTSGVPSFRALVSADIPTLNQNTTGTAAGLSSTLAIGSGGTGQTSAISAFNALAPSQSGNSGKYLTTDGTNSSWGTVSGGGSPGGSPNQVQFNSAGSFGGSANLTFNGTTLTAAGLAGPHDGTVGATTPATGSFTTLAASSTVSGTGFSTYLASPPAIGGTAAAAGTFTTGSFSSTVHRGSTSGTVTMTPPAVAGTQSYTLPSALPTADGLSLTATTAGVMSWGSAAPTSVSVDFLVIAGGGGASGGGGGAGGYRTSWVSGGANTPKASGGGQSVLSPITANFATPYTITVGAGGGLYTVGNDSVFATITSKGGGPASNGAGGSGGGSDGPNGVGGIATVSPVQGYNGGSATAASYAGGGGGGAGAAGGNATSASGGSGGVGGEGVWSDITTQNGTQVQRGGGGTGGYVPPGNVAGGAGGGGQGGQTSLPGTVNTGGGGGGGSANGPSAGGSGIVVLSIPSARTATFSGGVTQTSTTVGSNKIYTITATSTTSETVTFS